MSAPAATRSLPAPATGRARERTSEKNSKRGQWLRFTILSVITAIVLVPVAAVFLLALQPPVATGGSIGFDSFTYVLTQTAALQWLGNSLWVTLVTVIAAVVVAAPAGYVVSRGRNRLVAGYSLLLFVVQSLPVIVSVIPLFVLFAGLGLADSLTGITIIYVGGTLSVATWMMAAYFDSIPISLEEAAWMDGCSVFGSFLHVVLRNSLPGVLSTAIFSFLVCWNDYLIAVIFLRSNDRFTLPVGLQTFFQQNATDWGPVMAVAVIMLLPPITVFACLNRYFSVGGIGGSLAGQ
jgi:multiple sugar transport system permease protein